MRRNRWGALVFGILGPVEVVLGALTSNWLFLALGVVWIAMTVNYTWMWVRARRAIVLNEQLLA